MACPHRHQRPPRFPQILASLLLFARSSSAACYTPNGTDINQYHDAADGALYAPCNTTAAFGMCCATGPERTSPDSCMTDSSGLTGLCININLAGGPYYWRESCTDITWNDPACIKLFTFESGAQFGDVPLMLCPDGSWCDLTQGKSVATQCCNAKAGLFVHDDIISSQNPNTTETTTTSTTATATTPTVTSSTAINTTIPTTAGLQTSAKVGIGIGIGAGIIVLTIAILLFLYRKKQAKRRGEAEELAKLEKLGLSAGTGMPRKRLPSYQYHESRELEGTKKIMLQQTDGRRFESAELSGRERLEAPSQEHVHEIG